MTKRVGLLAMLLVLAAAQCPLLSGITGSVRVRIATTGPEPDQDGYVAVVRVAGQAPDRRVATATNDEVLITNMLAGVEWEIELTDLDDPCRVQGPNPLRVVPEADRELRRRFDVLCED